MSAQAPEIKAPETDTLIPPVAAVSYTIGPDRDIVLVQRPLSFFGKMELFSVLGSAIEKALDDGGISMAELLDEVPTVGKDLSSQDLMEADLFVKSLAKLVQYAPDFFKDLYCIALGVPRSQRDYIKNIMELPEADGGISDDQGIQILDTFVDQNWDVMVDFFKERIVPLGAKIGKKTGRASQSSKPSKATRARTPKA